MSAYLILKYIHVLAAIVAVGTNATYGVWMALGAAQPDSLHAILRGARFLDTRVANPAYGLLLITGLAMLYAGHLAIGTPWIATGLGLFIVGMALGARGYAPALRGQIQALEAGGPQSEAYRRASDGGRAIGLLFMVLVLVIIFLMVVKPTLWG